MKAFLPLTILALPFLEIAVFIAVGSAIGIFPTIGLTILGMVGGILIVKAQGFVHLRRMQAAMQAGEPPVADMCHTVLLLIAGILLVLPGFITDIIGLALLLPPVRAIAAIAFLKRFTVRHGQAGAQNTGGQGYYYNQRDDIIEGEFEEAPPAPRHHLSHSNDDDKKS